MITKKTVFVVGAGASREVDLPVSWELSERIQRVVRFPPDGDIPFVRSLANKHGEQNFSKLQLAGEIIADGLQSARSIDALLDRFSDDGNIAEVGKAAVIKLISEAEDGSFLKQTISQLQRPIGTNKITSTWFARFAEIVFAGARRNSDLQRIFENVTIICFNYDRCIEAYLIHELQLSFRIDQRAAADIVRQLKIWHPYGMLAPLDVLEPGGVPFGQNLSHECFAHTGSIRTFTEAQEVDTNAEVYLAEMESAELVVFLGFSYQKPNMELIAPRSPSAIRAVLGTCSGMSSNTVSIVEDRLERWAKSRLSIPKVKLADMHCSKFLEFYAAEFG